MAWVNKSGKGLKPVEVPLITSYEDIAAIAEMAERPAKGDFNDPFTIRMSQFVFDSDLENLEAFLKDKGIVAYDVKHEPGPNEFEFKVKDFDSIRKLAMLGALNHPIAKVLERQEERLIEAQKKQADASPDR